MGGGLRACTFPCDAPTRADTLLMRSLVQIPFRSFVRTNAGEMAEFQMEMMTENIKSVGISLLGGNSGVEGQIRAGDRLNTVRERRGHG